MVSTSEKASFLRKLFGSLETSRDKVNVAIKCPKCAKNTNKKKLVIRLDDDRYHCWVCGLKGRNLVSLLKSYAPSYLDEYKRKFLKTKGKLSVSEESSEKLRVDIPRGFTLLAGSASKDPDMKDVTRYVKSRGLSTREMWFFRMGTCLTGRFRRRVIIPSFDSEGNLNYYAARAIDHIDKMKYINARVPKTEVIFNEMNIDWKKELVLVEGPFDLTKCTDNATCLLGSHLSSDSTLFKKIIKNKTPIILALDPDAIKKSHEIASSLFSYDISVKLMKVPTGKDVGDMTKEEFILSKSSATVWNKNDRLINLIGSVRSGSLI